MHVSPVSSSPVSEAGDVFVVSPNLKSFDSEDAKNAEIVALKVMVARFEDQQGDVQELT